MMRFQRIFQSSFLIPCLMGALDSTPSWMAKASAAELPRAFVDTTYSPPGGLTIAVPAGGDFQAALDAAEPGDIIELEAGATFVGNFTLPYKTGMEWIYIRTSAHASLPAPGTRVFPSHADLMPQIVTPDSQPAIIATGGANHFRFVGIEISPAPDEFVFNVVGLGGLEVEDADLPHHIVFDRCYIHGDPVRATRRGIALNGRSLAVIDSYLSGFRDVLTDSQAIAGWGGPGPFKIANNYLEGAGENVLFGGADPIIPLIVPSDIEIRHNHFFKPLSWRVGDPSFAGVPWVVKNLFELKNARRVLIEGNIFEHNWVDAQNGFAILFTVRNQDGTAPWSVVEDVTFTRNIVRHSASGLTILGHDDIFPSEQTKRIVIRDNLFEDISAANWGDGIGGRLFQILSGAADITIEHNTGFHDGNLIVAEGAISVEDGVAATGFIYQNNIAPENERGVIGTDTATGIPTLTTFFPDAIFERNVQPGGDPTLYPLDNFFPPSLDDVGFVDLPGGDFRLASLSPFKGAGTDGKDIGADIQAIQAATADVVSGVTGVTGPPAPTRFEENHSSARCIPDFWFTQAWDRHSGGSMLASMNAGAIAGIDFTGTAVTWIGFRDSGSGIANVWIDGQMIESVDMFSSDEQTQVSLYTVSGLSPTTHRLKIEVTGTRNPDSRGTWVSVDAFEVTTDSGQIRVEEDDPSVFCSPCTCYENMLPEHSGGRAVLAMDAGSGMIFDFTGTGVSWIGYRDEWSGIARVYIDGILQSEVDTYASPHEAQAVLFTASGLLPGPHRLGIEVTGMKNPSSAGFWIWFDAFETLP